MAACPADLDAESATLSEDISAPQLIQSDSVTSQIESRDSSVLNPSPPLQESQDKSSNQATVSVKDLSDLEFKELLDDCISFRGVSGSGSQPFQKLLQEVGPPDPEPPVSQSFPFQLVKTHKRANRVRKEPTGPWLAFVKENALKNKAISKVSGISTSAAVHAKQGGSLQNLSSASDLSVGRRRRRREGSGGGGAGRISEGSRKREGGSLPCDGERERLVEEIDPNLKLNPLDGKLVARPARKSALHPSCSKPPKYTEIELQDLSASAASSKLKSKPAVFQDGWASSSSYGSIEHSPHGLDGDVQCSEEPAKVQRMYREVQECTVIQIDRDGELSECNVIGGLSREDSEDRHTEEMDVDCSDPEGKDETTALLGSSSKSKAYHNLSTQRKVDVDTGLHFGSLNSRRDSYNLTNGTSLEEGGAGKRSRGRQSSLDENGNPASAYDSSVVASGHNPLNLTMGLARNSQPSIMSSNKTGGVYSSAPASGFGANSSGQSNYELKKNKREKAKPKDKELFRAETVPGYRGDQDVQDILEFIESSDQSKKPQTMGDNRKTFKKDSLLSKLPSNTKTKGHKRFENGVDNVVREGRGNEKNLDRSEDSKEQRKNKARSQDGRQGRSSTSESTTVARGKDKVFQRSSSLENVSLRPSSSSQSSESLNGTSPDLMLTNPRTPAPATVASSSTPYQSQQSRSLLAEAMRPPLSSPKHDKSFEEPDFQTVTKRQRRKKNSKPPSAGVWSSVKAGTAGFKDQSVGGSLAPSKPSFNRFTSPRSKVRNLSRYSASSVPSSDRSDDDSDADDAHSVHSLPACPSGPSSAPQSYADIARVAKVAPPPSTPNVVLAYSVVTPSQKGGGGGNGGKDDDKNPPSPPAVTTSSEETSKADFPPLTIPNPSATNNNSNINKSSPSPGGAAASATAVVVVSPAASHPKDEEKDKKEKKEQILDTDYPPLEDTFGKPGVVRDNAGILHGPVFVTQAPPIGDWSRPLPLPRRMDAQPQTQPPLPFFNTVTTQSVAMQSVAMPLPAALSPRLPPPLTPQGIMLSPGAVPPNVLLRQPIMLPTTSLPYMIGPPHVVMPMPLLLSPNVPPPQTTPPSFLGPSLVMNAPPPPMHHTPTVPLGAVMSPVMPSSVSAIPSTRKTSLTTTISTTAKRANATSLSQLGRASSLPPPLPTPDMPPVVMMEEPNTPPEMEDFGLSFGFEVNEQLLAGSAGVTERSGLEYQEDNMREGANVEGVGERRLESFERGEAPTENLTDIGSAAVAGQNFAALYREVPEPDSVFQRNREIIAFVSQMWNGVARQLEDDSGNSGVKFYSSE